MFRIPKYFIVVFVGLSILTAYGIHRFQNSPSRGLASTTQSNQLQSLENGAEEILSFSRSSDASCYCLRNNSKRSLDVIPEENSTCAPERQYLNSMLENLPILYRESRMRSPSEFPKECMIYSMKKWRLDSSHSTSRFASRCDRPDSDEVAASPKPCVSKTYVNVVYNYFSDVTDCFGISQRRWIPKFYYETGFHMNARSANGEFGFGQLTVPVLSDANRVFSNYQAQVKDNNKASCERLNSAVEKLVPIRDLKQGACARVQALQDPLLSLFYVTVVELQNRSLIHELLNRSRSHRMSLVDKMEKLGLVKGSYDLERLVEILALLGSNAGPESAVILLANYLEDFGHFAHRSLKVSDLSLHGTSDKVRSFFEYVRDNQISGDSNYLNAIAEKAKDLNLQFKEGACVPESFLSL